MRVRRLLLIAAAAVLTSCGSSTPSPEAPKAELQDDATRRKPKLEMQSELGLLNVKEVDAVFTGLRGEFSRCFDSGNRFAAGNVTYRVRVNHSHQAKWAYVSQSSLGDRNVEKCMISALMRAKWPLPDGGEDGLAEKPFEFPDREDRPPVEWSTDRVAATLAKGRSSLDSCLKASHGSFHVTAIVETSGKVASAGVASPDETSDETADCLAEAVTRLKMPSPGSWPAKVTFEIR